MDENAGWAKPKKSFKLKKTTSRKSEVNRKEIGSPFSSVRLSITLPSEPSAGSTKRRNPFSLHNEDVDQKRQKLSKNFFLSPDSGFAQSSDSQDSGCGSSQSQDQFQENIRSLAKESQTVAASPALDLPLDWSLKSRLTFTSKQHWPWREHISTAEAASSVTGGVRCLDIAKGNHCLDTSASTQFHAACLYWQHPSLPGLSLYPRAAGIGGSQQILALLTPTTSGVRAALKREDVEFTQPLQPTLPADGDKGEDAHEKGETSTEILESLGIEADSLPGFSTTTNKTVTPTGVTLDGKASSMVYVEGVECQSLLNYLLNAKLSQGPGGVPPTILAPVAFPGAVLKSLKVKEHTLGSKAGDSKSFQIDLQGPILPHTLQTLANLSVNHCPTSNLRTHTQEDTISFSIFSLPKDSVAPSAFASANLNDCGLPEPLLKKFCKVRSGKTDVTVLREINFRQGGFELIDDEEEDDLFNK